MLRVDNNFHSLRAHQYFRDISISIYLRQPFLLTTKSHYDNYHLLQQEFGTCSKKTKQIYGHIMFSGIFALPTFGRTHFQIWAQIWAGCSCLGKLGKTAAQHVALAKVRESLSHLMIWGTHAVHKSAWRSLQLPIASWTFMDSKSGWFKILNNLYFSKTSLIPYDPIKSEQTICFANRICSQWKQTAASHQQCSILRFYPLVGDPHLPWKSHVHQTSRLEFCDGGLSVEQ